MPRCQLQFRSAPRRSSLAAAIVAIASFSCVEHHPPIPTPHAVEADPHGIAASEFFVADRELLPDFADALDVDVATMTQKAHDGDHPSTFLDARTGQSLTSSIFWYSRPAIASELHVGSIVACVHRRQIDGLWSRPESAMEARVAPWSIARVTDVGKLDHGVLGVASSTCALDATRIVKRP